MIFADRQDPPARQDGSRSPDAGAPGPAPRRAEETGSGAYGPTRGVPAARRGRSMRRRSGRGRAKGLVSAPGAAFVVSAALLVGALVSAAGVAQAVAGGLDPAAAMQARPFAAEAIAAYLLVSPPLLLLSLRRWRRRMRSLLRRGLVALAAVWAAVAAACFLALLA